MFKCKIHGYCLTENCPRCDEKAVEVKVAKFSPEDKYGKYRREEKWSGK